MAQTELDADLMAKALIRCDLMRRYQYYALLLPGIDITETAEEMARSWAPHVILAYHEVEREQGSGPHSPGAGHTIVRESPA